MTRGGSRRHRPIRCLAGAALLAVPGVLAAQRAAPTAAPPDTAIRVAFGAFVDGCYPCDVNRPRDLDPAFTTQPARHDEFDVNLAFVEATLAGPRVGGRLALQAGTSVQANYAGEPTTGTVSGSTLSRHIQEAVAGSEATPGLWVDAGVFFALVEMEGWVSRDKGGFSCSASSPWGARAAVRRTEMTASPPRGTEASWSRGCRRRPRRRSPAGWSDSTTGTRRSSRLGRECRLAGRTARRSGSAWHGPRGSRGVPMCPDSGRGASWSPPGRPAVELRRRRGTLSRPDLLIAITPPSWRRAQSERPHRTGTPAVAASAPGRGPRRGCAARHTTRSDDRRAVG